MIVKDSYFKIKFIVFSSASDFHPLLSEIAKGGVIFCSKPAAYKRTEANKYCSEINSVKKKKNSQLCFNELVSYPFQLVKAKKKSL